MPMVFRSYSQRLDTPSTFLILVMMQLLFYHTCEKGRVYEAVWKELLGALLSLIKRYVRTWPGSRQHVCFTLYSCLTRRSFYHKNQHLIQSFPCFPFISYSK